MQLISITILATRSCASDRSDVGGLGELQHRFDFEYLHSRLHLRTTLLILVSGGMSRFTLLVAITYLFGSVAGWGFLPARSVAEGATATFQITNTDGGGYSFPYTMTVLKQVENSNDEQVGLVYTNDTTFYWECNQAAGTSLRFRLVSKANVNAATSDYMTVQFGAQATASSLSLKSLASVTSKQDPTSAQSSGTAAATQAAGNDQISQENVPVGAIVGGVVGGVLVVLIIAFAIIRTRRARKSSYVPEVSQQEPVTPFTYGHSPQQTVPPMGYVTYSSYPNEEPPVYSPHGTDAATSYFTGPGSSTGGAMTEISETPPARRGKTGYAPVSMRPR